MNRAPLTIAEIVDIHQFLVADQSTPVDDRHHRDREVGLQLSQLSSGDQVISWWRGLAVKKLGSGARVMRVRGYISWAMLLVGWVIGMSAATLALTYDGGYPINILSFLGVLVLLPGLLLLATLLGLVAHACGYSGRGHIVNINRWLMGLWSRFSDAPLLNEFGQQQALARLSYWLVMAFSQTFAVGFFSGVLLQFCLMVAFSDLAFGWSSTLEISVTSVSDAVNALAAPWAWLFPQWVPAESLVAQSQYYRLAPMTSSEEAAALGGWWPFLCLTLLTWGLLPRLLLALIARWRVGAHLFPWLLDHSEVTLLLERMSTPRLAAGATDGVPEVLPSTATYTDMEQANLSGGQVVIYNDAWSHAAAADRFASVFMLRSWEGMEAQAGLLSKLKAERTVVVVKGWEPPLLECLDFFRMLRVHLGDQVPIAIVPVMLAEQQDHVSDAAIWRSSVASLGDPRCVVSGTFVAGPTGSTS